MCLFCGDSKLQMDPAVVSTGREGGRGEAGENYQVGNTVNGRKTNTTICRDVS